MRHSIRILIASIFLAAGTLCSAQNWCSYPTGKDAVRDSVLLSVLDTLNVTPTALLSQSEATYFALRLGKDEVIPALTDKHICFLLRQDTMSNKSVFFRTEKDRLARQHTTPGYLRVYLFDETERDLSGGFDGAILMSAPLLYQKSYILKQIMRIIRNRNVPAE